MQLSKNFCLSEFTRSDTAKRLGINNDNVNMEVVLNLAFLCHMVLQPLRDRFGPISISSGFRTKALNQAVGGAPNSQHLTGEAADISLPSWQEGKEYFRYLSTLPIYDQLIWEQRTTTCWIHISIKRLGTNRRQILSDER